MNQKKYKNSIMIEGNYNFNYLTNLLFLCEQCLYQAIENNDFELKKNKKMLKNIKNLCAFFDSSIEIFSRLSTQNNEEKCIIHSIEYREDKPSPVPTLEDATVATVEDIRKSFENDNNVTTGLRLVSDLSNDVINKDKEVDSKYDEEE